MELLFRTNRTFFLLCPLSFSLQSFTFHLSPLSFNLGPLTFTLLASPKLVNNVPQTDAVPYKRYKPDKLAFDSMTQRLNDSMTVHNRITQTLQSP
jgi:hypothetical protein